MKVSRAGQEKCPVTQPLSRVTWWEWDRSITPTRRAVDCITTPSSCDKRMRPPVWACGLAQRARKPARGALGRFHTGLTPGCLVHSTRHRQIADLSRSTGRSFQQPKHTGRFSNVVATAETALCSLGVACPSQQNLQQDEAGGTGTSQGEKKRTYLRR